MKQVSFEKTYLKTWSHYTIFNEHPNSLVTDTHLVQTHTRMAGIKKYNKIKKAFQLNKFIYLIWAVCLCERWVGHWFNSYQVVVSSRPAISTTWPSSSWLGDVNGEQPMHIYTGFTIFFSKKKHWKLTFKSILRVNWYYLLVVSWGATDDQLC